MRRTLNDSKNRFYKKLTTFVPQPDNLNSQNTLEEQTFNDFDQELIPIADFNLQNGAMPNKDKSKRKGDRPNQDLPRSP